MILTLKPRWGVRGLFQTDKRQRRRVETKMTFGHGLARVGGIQIWFIRVPNQAHEDKHDIHLISEYKRKHTLSGVAQLLPFQLNQKNRLQPNMLSILL